MLRLFVLILLLLNVGYFTWSQGWLLAYGWGPVPQSEPQRLAQQVHPEAIVLLSESDNITPAPAPQVAASAPADAICLLSNTLNAAQAQVLQPLLAAHLAHGTWSLDEEVTAARWLIYMGRFTSAAEQASKRAQLIDLKVKFEPVDVPGLSPGFALGSFTTLAATESALQELNKRGVRTAKMTQVQAASSSYRLRLPAGDPTQQTLELIKDTVPDMVLQPCPEPETN